MLSPLRVLDYSFSFGIDNILASINERCRLFYEAWNLLNSTFYWLFTVANQWLVLVMFIVCSPDVELKVIFHLYVCLCVCMSVCACSHVWAWACAWLIIAHLEVRSQPWVLDLAFSPFVCHCVLQASWVPCAPPPVFHPAISCARVIDLSYCLQCYMGPGDPIQGSDTFSIKSLQQALMLLLLT